MQVQRWVKPNFSTHNESKNFCILPRKQKPQERFLCVPFFRNNRFPQQGPTERTIPVPRLAWEHMGWDPIGGELCLGRVKPGEILVEARSSADVQIACQTWV